LKLGSSTLSKNEISVSFLLARNLQDAHVLLLLLLLFLGGGVVCLFVFDDTGV
jgi:hypothetical protein